MADIKHLLKAAENFHLRTVVAQQQQANQYTNLMIRKMQALVPPAIASVDHLLANPQYQKSIGLKALKSQLPAVANQLATFVPADSGNDFYDSLGNMVTGLMYYTQGNAGTGHDPATNVSLGGYTPPSYYVNALVSYFDKIKPKTVQQAPSSDTIGSQMQAQLADKTNPTT